MSSLRERLPNRRLALRREAIGQEIRRCTHDALGRCAHHDRDVGPSCFHKTVLNESYRIAFRKKGVPFN